MMFKIVLLSALIGSAVCLNCTTLSDGTYYIGCKVFAVCTNGHATEKECSVGYVYSARTKSCDKEKNVPPPCGLHKDCSQIHDGSYADKSRNCTSYYTCAHHVYYGHNYCTPGTVFEDTMGTCVWPADAYAPCGTKTK